MPLLKTSLNEHSTKNILVDDSINGLLDAEITNREQNETNKRIPIQLRHAVSQLDTIERGRHLSKA